jgi:hypothetical protein
MKPVTRTLSILFALAMIAASVIVLTGSHTRQIEQPPPDQWKSEAPIPGFGEYWYQGKAEVTSYSLEQARYGEMRQGEAVLVFVTENLDNADHVKTDDPSRASTPVLKLNFMKNFLTGIYPYSMMMSVFSPDKMASNPAAIKITTASQEWCGHTFLEFNREGNRYGIYSNSYFPNEAVKRSRLNAIPLEDEIWTQIRIRPESLPTGEFEMVPGSFYLRLRHQEIKGYPVKASFSTGEGKGVYSLFYPGLGRSLAITFEDAFPHKILEWEETYESGWGAGRKELTTRASLLDSEMLDYWNLNSVADSTWRQKLGLK